jgi:hypothetical protein
MEKTRPRGRDDDRSRHGLLALETSGCEGVRRLDLPPARDVRKRVAGGPARVLPTVARAARYLMWDKIRKMVDKNTGGHYPASYAIVDCVRYGLAYPTGPDKFRHEREGFARLVATDESAALVGLFDGATRMKKRASGALS